MRVLELDPTAGPAAWGRAHGESFRGPIHDLAAIRLGLTVSLGAFASEDEVLAVARQHLPVLERFDGDLYAELLGIAEGAAIEPERIVVLNHYTDLRDIRPGGGSAGDAGGPAEDDCSAVWTRTDRGVLLGQTWDMHGSAEPFVMMLGVPARDGAPAAWLFSIVGCLGMTGMNDAGVGITINNLKSLDAQVGIVWPALVRRVLKERKLEAARDAVLDAPLGSGHHYIVASAEGGYGIETSGTKKKVLFDGAAASTRAAYVHTNHCLDDELAALSTVNPTSTTRERYEALTSSVNQRSIVDRADFWHRLGSHEGYPRSVCTHLASPDAPHAMRTCGALVMDPSGPDLWAAPGCIHLARPHLFGF